jgi:hypothetical protein
MKILQISAVLEPKYAGEAAVYGLGEDNNIYLWNPRKKEWLLFEMPEK